MTDGTSQGLFIVVAIVIFGIFVSLSYTVFGDGLGNSLPDMVSTAVSKPMSERWVEVDLTSRVSRDRQDMEVLDYTDNSVHIRANNTKNNYNGVRIGEEHFEPNNEYRLSFTVHKLDGNIDNIGGHLHFAHRNRLYADGELQPNRFRSGNLYDNSKDSIDYVLYFDSDGLIEVDGVWQATDPYSSGYYNPVVSIVTNRSRRLGDLEEHEFKITDITLEKSVPSLR